MAVVRSNLEVTVSEPEKKGEGLLSSYISYKVNTRFTSADGKLHQSSVVRRYSDFLWLHGQLTAQNTGYLVPPMPEKALIGRFNPLFVDSRRRGLELFLNRLAQHAALSKFKEVELFLFGENDFIEFRDNGGAVPVEADEAGGASAAAGGGAAAAPAAAAPAAKKSAAKGMFDYIGDLASSVTSTVTGGPKEREKTREDQSCDGILAYADTLENSVGSVHKNIKDLTARTKDYSVAWFNFGFACTLLAQYEAENEEKQLGEAFVRLGSCADRLSVLLTQQVDTQAVHFEEPFHDFLRIVGAVKEMIKGRNAVLAQYNASLSSLESKTESLKRYQARPGKELKVKELEQQVAEAQAQVDADAENLRVVTQRVFAETARFRKEKKINFKNSLADFIRMQIEHSKKVQAAWENILPDIDGMPTE